ncbi:hypothetical protein ACFOQM_10775 [Paenibacillus sp. GCM10012307]|uniref:Uncharacterized protein n=1 Tax=Paenibacillus roseus TaxID=2798579 RepID=A0A934J7L6_9BACL|nr:hypothetical protein [Paenibacillus roseus]MBJ6361768.1 hypothetical protein [Paenibacillus roseus]
MKKTVFRQAIKVLRRVLDENFTKEEQALLEWKPAIKTDATLQWRFIFKGDGKLRTYTYIRSVNNVVIRRID